MPLAVSSPPFVLGLVDTKFPILRLFYNSAIGRNCCFLCLEFSRLGHNEWNDGKWVGFELERLLEKASDFGLKHHFASSETFALILTDIVS